MRSVCTVELRVTVNYIKILSVAKNALWQIHHSGNNRTCLGLHVYCPILTKFVASKQTSMKTLNMKFHRHLSNGISAYKSGQTDSNRRSLRLKRST
jgi:hypothetical protein